MQQNNNNHNNIHNNNNNYYSHLKIRNIPKTAKFQRKGNKEDDPDMT